MASEVALVTGAAGGIGRCVTELLLARGGRVLASDVDGEGLAELARQRNWPSERVATRALDVRSADAWAAAVQDAVDRWGRLDQLFNIAGYLRPSAIHESRVEDVERHLDINTKGPILGTRAAAHQMVRQGRGHIVTIGSMASLAPVPGIGLYSASKYAVRAFCLIAAQELKEHGVAVTVVCPDAVQTPMLDLQLDYREAALTFSGSKLLTPEAVAEVVAGPRVLDKQPLEVWIPPSRGAMAKFTDLVPSVGFRLGNLLKLRGRAKQEKLKAEAEGSA